MSQVKDTKTLASTNEVSEDLEDTDSLPTLAGNQIEPEPRDLPDFEGAGSLPSLEAYLAESGHLRSDSDLSSAADDRIDRLDWLINITTTMDKRIEAVERRLDQLYLLVKDNLDKQGSGRRTLPSLFSRKREKQR